MEVNKLREIVETLKNISDRTTDTYRLGVDLIDYNSDFHSVITLLLKDVMSEEGFDWFEWYCYEKNFGRDSEMKAWDENKNEICRNVEELHKLIFGEQ